MDMQTLVEASSNRPASLVMKDEQGKYISDYSYVCYGGLLTKERWREHAPTKACFLHLKQGKRQDKSEIQGTDYEEVYLKGINLYYDVLLSTPLGPLLHAESREDLITKPVVDLREVPSNWSLPLLSHWRYPSEFPFSCTAFYLMVEEGVPVFSALMLSSMFCRTHPFNGLFVYRGVLHDHNPIPSSFRKSSLQGWLKGEVTKPRKTSTFDTQRLSGRVTTFFGRQHTNSPRSDYCDMEQEVLRSKGIIAYNPRVGTKINFREAIKSLVEWYFEHGEKYE